MYSNLLHNGNFYEVKNTLYTPLIKYYIILQKYSHIALKIKYCTTQTNVIKVKL